MADYDRRSRLFGAIKKEFMKAPPSSSEDFKKPFEFEFPMPSSDDYPLVANYHHTIFKKPSTNVLAPEVNQKFARITLDQQFLLDRDNLSLIADEIRDLETAFAKQRGYSIELLPSEDELLKSKTVYLSSSENPNILLYTIKQSDGNVIQSSISLQDLGLQARNEPLSFEQCLTVKDEILAKTTERGHTPSEDELEHAFQLFCCTLLEKFYKPFNKAKWKQYRNLRMEIESYWTGKSEKKASQQEAFTIACGQKIADEIINIIQSPFHTSRMISLISFLNMYRIFWAFIRMFVFSLLGVLATQQLWEKASRFLHNTINMNKFIDALKLTNYVLYPLSVAFFIARFGLTVAEIVKFTFFPGKNSSSTWFARLKGQLKDEDIHTLLVNDMVWPLINFVTNYAESIARLMRQFFHHAGHLTAAAPWILFSFLFFDTAIFLYAGYRKYDKYLLKRAGYLKELEDQSICPERKLLIAKQLIACENQWKIDRALIFYTVTASLIIAAGFGLSMLLSPPLLALAAYAACLIGVAMYISKDDFKKWQESRIKLNMAESTSKNVRVAKIEHTKARKEFFIGLAINVVVPSLIIACFALSWQLALVITAAFALYQLYRAYSKYRQGKTEEVVKEEPKSKHKITFNFGQVITQPKSELDFNVDHAEAVPAL